jgi:DNA-binding CsgD family transcriptional regulator
MTKQVIWTKQILEEFIKEGNLNERQEYIIRTRVQGYTITRQALELHLSIDQVNKDIRTLKHLYDVVSLNNSKLPPRMKNKSELYKKK